MEDAWAGTLHRVRVRWGGVVPGRLRQLLPRTVCLAGLMALAGMAYAFHYPHAVKSTQALALLGAAMAGQGVGLWEMRNQKVESRNGAGGAVVGVLMVLLLGAAVWQAETGHLFQYRSQARWSGPWDNPNTFGMLMGVGLVLAVGTALSRLRSRVLYFTFLLSVFLLNCQWRWSWGWGC